MTVTEAYRAGFNHAIKLMERCADMDLSFGVSLGIVRGSLDDSKEEAKQ